MELLVTCTEDFVEETKANVTRTMILAAKISEFNIDAEASDGPSWGDCH